MDKERDFVMGENQEPPKGSVSSRNVSPVIMDIIERKVKVFLEEKKIYLVIMVLVVMKLNIQ